MKYLCIFILALVHYAHGQQLSITTGIGSYAMNRMKDHGKELQKTFPVDARFVDDFPAYFYYELSLTQRLRNSYLGGAIGYGSTGARINYTDYSGSINMDQNVRYIELAPVFETLLNPDALNNLFKFTFKPTVSFGMYDLIFSTRIGDQVEKDEMKFNSINFGIVPGISYSRHILNNFDVVLHAGYNLNLYKGDLIFDENDNYFLQDNNGSKVTLDWSGIRAGVSAAYNFSW